MVSSFTHVALLTYICIVNYFVKAILSFVRKEQLIHLSVFSNSGEIILDTGENSWTPVERVELLVSAFRAKSQFYITRHIIDFGSPFLKGGTGKVFSRVPLQSFHWELNEYFVPMLEKRRKKVWLWAHQLIPSFSHSI